MEIFLRPDTAITLSPCCFSGEKWSFPTSLEVENTISQSYYSLQVMLMVSPLFVVVVGVFALLYRRKVNGERYVNGN